jgi:hypothetical protein
MQRAHPKMPHLARTAARIFMRYWRYGPDTESPGQPTLWALAGEVLGQEVKPHRVVHAGR